MPKHRFKPRSIRKPVEAKEAAPFQPAPATRKQPKAPTATAAPVRPASGGIHLKPEASTAAPVAAGSRPTAAAAPSANGDRKTGSAGAAPARRPGLLGPAMAVAAPTARGPATRALTLAGESKTSVPLCKKTLPYSPGCDLGVGFSTNSKDWGPTVNLFNLNLLTPADKKQATFRTDLMRTDLSYRFVNSASEALDALNVSGELQLKTRLGAASVQVDGSGRYLKNEVNRDTTIEILGVLTHLSHTERLNTPALQLATVTIDGKTEAAFTPATAGSHFISETVWGGGMIVSLLWKFSDAQEKSEIEAKLHGNVEATSATIDIKGQFAKIANELNQRTRVEASFTFWGGLTVSDLLNEAEKKDLADNKANVVSLAAKDPTCVLRWMNTAAKKLAIAEGEAGFIEKVCTQVILTPLAALAAFTDLTNSTAVRSQRVSDGRMKELARMYDELSEARIRVNDINTLLASAPDGTPLPKLSDDQVDSAHDPPAPAAAGTTPASAPAAVPKDVDYYGVLIESCQSVIRNFMLKSDATLDLVTLEHRVRTMQRELQVLWEMSFAVAKRFGVIPGFGVAMYVGKGEALPNGFFLCDQKDQRYTDFIKPANEPKTDAEKKSVAADVALKQKMVPNLAAVVDEKTDKGGRFVIGAGDAKTAEFPQPHAVGGGEEHFHTVKFTQTVATNSVSHFHNLDLLPSSANNWSMDAKKSGVISLSDSTTPTVSSADSHTHSVTVALAATGKSVQEGKAIPSWQGVSYITQFAQKLPIPKFQTS